MIFRGSALGRDGTGRSRAMYSCLACIFLWVLVEELTHYYLVPLNGNSIACHASQIWFEFLNKSRRFLVGNEGMRALYLIPY